MPAEPGARAYWVAAPGRGELRPVSAVPGEEAGRSWIRADFGAVSCGTERLVGLGLVPDSCAAQMSCPYMDGSFSLPVKYGYSLVGSALDGELAGERVFVMHPHQELVRVRDRDCVVLPATVPSRRAVLFPNLETALNAVWDAELSGTERCAIVGAGAVGVLIAFALQAEHALAPVAFERDEARRDSVQRFSWVAGCADPAAAERGGFDVVFHCSGNPEALDFALALLGFEGRVLELSWYGERRASLSLGGDFHYLRKRLVASQVGHVAPAKRESLGREGRTRRVLELLGDARLDEIVGPELPFGELPSFMDAVYRGRATPLVPLLHYSHQATTRP